MNHNLQKYCENMFSKEEHFGLRETQKFKPGTECQKKERRFLVIYHLVQVELFKFKLEGPEAGTLSSSQKK